jgi:uncharacterized protein YqiB (DUF1249 family)
MRTVYEMIYARLQQLGIIDESGKMKANYMKFISSGLMPLNVDMLISDTIALVHNGKHNGDVMSDPDMEIKIYPEMKMAEALTFSMITLEFIKRFILNLRNITKN